MRTANALKWTAALVAIGLLGGAAVSRAEAAFLLEVKALSTDHGTVSADGKEVDVPGHTAANVTLGIYMTHTLDADTAHDPFQFGLGSLGITVNSQDDTVNGVPAPGTIGNVTYSTLHGGPNDPDNPANGGSGFALPANFNLPNLNGGDGTLTTAEISGMISDPDIDVVLLGIAQDELVAPLQFLPFYGASRTVGVPVTTLLGTLVFTTNNNIDTGSTQIGIYMPITTGAFNASVIRSLMNASTSPASNNLGPRFMNSSNLGTRVTIAISVPEPASVGLVALGAAALVQFRCRRR